MIYFFGKPTAKIYAVQKKDKLDTPEQNKLIWLFGNSPLIGNQKIEHQKNLNTSYQKLFLAQFTIKIATLIQGMKNVKTESIFDGIPCQ